MERKYYVVATTVRGMTIDKGWPLCLEPKTKKQARMSIDWQVAGGVDAEEFIIVEVEPDLPGVMFHFVDGVRRPVLLNKGPYTDAAYADFLLSIWADCVGVAA
jgi:hypothetical protein